MPEIEKAPTAKRGDTVDFTWDRGSHVEALPATVVRVHPDGHADLAVHGAGRHFEVTHVAHNAKGLVGTWRAL
jgi:hypothetical protein